MKTNLKILVGSLLCILITLPGCTSYPATTFEIDMKEPVDIRQAPHVMPPFPESTYRMYLAKETILLKKHGITLLTINSTLKKCQQGRPGECPPDAYELVQSDLKRMIKETEKVEKTVRQLNPPTQLRTSHEDIIENLEKYRQHLGKATIGEYEHTINAHRIYIRLIDMLRGESI